MKLFSISTRQTRTLKNDWFLKTLQDDWDVHIFELDDAPTGEGDYQSESWYFCIEKKIGILVQAIRDNWGDIILWADIDIQFFRPCTQLVLDHMQGHDLACQMWHRELGDVNTGFMAIRCNERSLAFFEAARETPFEGRAFADQDVINDLLDDGVPPIRWTRFPRQIYQIKLGRVPGDIALHHACGTPAPHVKDGRTVTSIDLKIEQLVSVRTLAEYSPLQRAAVRVTGPVVRRVKRLGAALGLAGG
ncbi:MAG: hypothetical protein HKN72_02620 [Gemmatimonadetes bacterium]|nr:hypothetical protein [Gemmatimonadota bacterium]